MRGFFPLASGRVGVQKSNLRPRILVPEREEGSWSRSRLLASALFLLLSFGIAQARDDGRYANSDLKPWFDQLQSRKGPCCSDADGFAISDADWETKDGHYRVKIDGEWYDVPDEALITEPNRAGRTMVWPIRYWSGNSLTIVIRCFMPGSMI